MQSEDHPFVESHMQVDEPADDHTNPSTPERPILPPTVTQSRVSIPEKAVQGVCKQLERYILPGDDDNSIREDLNIVWIVVHDALSQAQTLRARLADQDEFQENVQKYGEKEFIELLRDMAKRKNWRDLLENDVFLQNPEWSLTPASMDASVRAWGATFKGQAADVLLDTIADYLERRRNVYAMQTCFVNSSGTGKSRMVHEVATQIITVPMCLRLNGTQGFPPPDVDLRDWFKKLAYAKSMEQAMFAKRLHDFMYSLLTILLKWLQEIESAERLAEVKSGQCRIPRIPASYESQDRPLHEELVKKRQEKLASEFCDLMTAGISFESHNDYRLHFYKDVMLKLDERSRAPQGSTSHRPIRYIYEVEEEVKAAGERLCRFIDPHGVLDMIAGSRRPLVILAFDESHILTEFPKHCDWTLFSELCRALHAIAKQPIFSLFLATAGSFHLSSPEIISDPSSRLINCNLRSLGPITEISFDDLAYPAKEGTVSLSQVVTTSWISHLGRPLFGAYYDALAGNESELLILAKQKLLNGSSRLVDGDDSGPLACLSARFALEFNADSRSRNVAYTQVGHHMQLCLAATAGFKELTTLSGSEPFLAEAALQLVHDSGANPVHHLANYPDLNCLKIGRGELVVAALIIMQARDTAVAAQPPTQGRRWVSVSDFMRALLPNEKFIELQGSLPTSCRVGEDRPFVETFQNYAMWYNHVIRIEADDMINTKLLWSFITRGAMIMAPYNQSSVDIVLPLCLKTGKLSRSTVSAMLIQVKTSDKYGYDIDEALFGGLSPFRVGLFDSGSTPRPVIRMVFALTSSKSGIHLPEVRERPRTSSHQDFTAFDIWCAGLSSFKNICEDLASYEILLGRSLRPREFELLREDADLNDATRELRELRRQTMAALPMLHDEHP